MRAQEGAPFVVVLGPQRLHTTLPEVVQELGLSGGIALITAGWQERESEDEELRAALGEREGIENLHVHGRCERVYELDQELFQAHRRRQDELRTLQQLHRVRLDDMLSCTRRLLRWEGELSVLDPEREDAIRMVRALDQHHLKRILEVHQRFEEEWQFQHRLAVIEEHEYIKELLSQCDTVAIAGGHVAVLLNRMRMLNLAPLLEGKNLLLWSAGAMALSQSIVLFHDSPPQGKGNPEVLDAGLGLLPDLVPLPHAKRRLRLDDPIRISLFARRFAPALCVALDEGSRVDWREGEHGHHWQMRWRTSALCTDGSLERVEER